MSIEFFFQTYSQSSLWLRTKVNFQLQMNRITLSFFYISSREEYNHIIGYVSCKNTFYTTHFPIRIFLQTFVEATHNQATF